MHFVALVVFVRVTAYGVVLGDRMYSGCGDWAAARSHTAARRRHEH